MQIDFRTRFLRIMPLLSVKQAGIIQLDKLEFIKGGHIMSKSKRILFWTICYILSFVSLIIAFPIVLFTFYPHSIIAIVIYTIVMVILSALNFHKSAIKLTAIKPMLLVFLLIPIVTLITVLVSIETGWLHFPG